MKQLINFDDVLITPQFSNIKSRKDVSTKQLFLGETITPIISSNMDTVTESQMAMAMAKYGARGCLHRFQTIEKNVEEFKLVNHNADLPVYVSIGLGTSELERASALIQAGATHIVLDVAHGANMEVVKQTIALRSLFKNIKLIVGNFATKNEILSFKSELGENTVDAWKVGIGGGSACTTRLVTGAGWPTLASILDCRDLPEPIIADGGIRNSGDYAKALAAGASAVMIGNLLAGTQETPGELYDGETGEFLIGYSQDFMWRPVCKKYRGSASKESYAVQNKDSSWRTAEGDSYLVPIKGSALDVLQTLDAGLRSAMSYVGASNLQEFREKAELVQITPAGQRESTPHGKS